MQLSIKNLSALIFPACILSLAVYSQTPKTNATMTDKTTQITLPPASGFERTIDGKPTHLYVLKNKKGMEVAITNYGGHLVGALVPDKAGKLISVVLGFDNI